MRKLFYLTFLFFVTIPQVQAVLIREGDTDEASLARASAYPAVCRLEFIEGRGVKQGSGVLIKVDGGIGWVLTAQHNVCVENPEDPFYVWAYFENSEGRKFTAKPLACAIPKRGPIGITSCGIEKDLSLIAYELPDLFDIAPLPLCTSPSSVMTCDTDAGIRRGEGCIVGYGYHGINNKPESYGIDQKKRHAWTYFMEEERSSHRRWSLFSTLSVAPSSQTSIISPYFLDCF